MTSITPSGPLVGMPQIGDTASGFQMVATTRLDLAATAINVPDIPHRDFLLVLISAVGMSGSFIKMRLGTAAGAYDSGANYWHRNMESVENGNIVPGNYNNTGSGSAPEWKVGYESTTSTNRFVLMSIFNNSGRVTGQWAPARATGAAATIGFISSGWGEWFSGPVRALQVSTVDGTSTFGPRSGITVFGRSI